MRGVAGRTLATNQARHKHGRKQGGIRRPSAQHGQVSPSGPGAEKFRGLKLARERRGLWINFQRIACYRPLFFLLYGMMKSKHRSPIWLKFGIVAVVLSAIATLLLLARLDQQTMQRAIGRVMELPGRMIRYFSPPRPRVHKPSCVNNLRQLQGAKEVWRLKYKKPDTATPALADLVGKDKYIRDKLICPGGGSYIIGSGAEKPYCTVPEHTLPPDP